MKWNPISTAPKTGRSILGFNADWQTVQQVEWSKPDGFWIYSEELLAQIDEEANPTHWMKLPDEPQPLESADTDKPTAAGS